MTLKISRSQVSTQPNPTHQIFLKKTLTQPMDGPNPWPTVFHTRSFNTRLSIVSTKRNNIVNKRRRCRFANSNWGRFLLISSTVYWRLQPTAVTADSARCIWSLCTQHVSLNNACTGTAYRWFRWSNAHLPIQIWTPCRYHNKLCLP